MVTINTTFTLTSPDSPEVDLWQYPKALILTKTSYSSTNNRLCVELCIQHENFLTGFARTYFEGLEAKLMPYHSQTDDGLYISDKFFQSVVIDGKNARDAIDRLFRQKLISAEVRSNIEGPLKALELCLENSQRVNAEITPAQQSTLEFFAQPYIETLKENFQGWKLDAALGAACKNCSLDEQFFHDTMEYYHVSNNTADEECVPILADDWEESKKKEITGAFYIISRLLMGLSDLENTLLQQGPNLPSLGVQKRIILALLK